MPALVPVKASQFTTADAMRTHYVAVGKRLGKPSAEANPVVIMMRKPRVEISEQRRQIIAASMQWPSVGNRDRPLFSSSFE
jgi:hypothetical protein